MPPTAIARAPLKRSAGKSNACAVQTPSRRLRAAGFRPAWLSITLILRDLSNQFHSRAIKSALCTSFLEKRKFDRIYTTENGRKGPHSGRLEYRESRGWLEAATGSVHPGDVKMYAGCGFDHIAYDGGLRARVGAPCSHRGASVDTAMEVPSNDGVVRWTFMRGLRKRTGTRKSRN